MRIMKETNGICSFQDRIHLQPHDKVFFLDPIDGVISLVMVFVKFQSMDQQYLVQL